MDVLTFSNGQAFQWDGNKARANLEKHQVSFEEACEVFFDPFVRILDASDNQEPREAAVGMTEGWNLLLVVHLLKDGETIRIISARRATPAERRSYENE